MNVELENALERWEQAGLLSADQGTRIREFEGVAAVEPRMRLPILLGLAFGSIMLAAGILLFVSAHWIDLSPIQRMSLLVFGVAGLHSVAALCAERFPGTASALHATGTAAAGAAIFLAGQIFNLEEHWPTGVLLWAVGSAAAWWLLRDWPQLAFAAVITPLWLLGEWTDATRAVAGAVQIASVGAVLLAICYLSVPFPYSRVRDANVANTYAWIGSIALVPSSVAVILGRWETGVRHAAPGGLTVLGWAGAILIPLAFAYFYRRQHAWMNAVAAVWVVGLSWMSDQHHETSTYAWCALGAAGLIAWGLVELRAERINLGMAAFALTIISFFFSSIMDKLGRSLSLVTLGIIFLAGGWYWERLRRKLVTQVREGGAR